MVNRDIRSDGVTVDNDFYNAENNPQLKKKMQNNGSGQPEYIGEAWPGTATSEAKWRIKKMEYDDGKYKPPTGQVWADGEASFSKVWDNRASYSYS